MDIDLSCARCTTLPMPGRRSRRYLQPAQMPRNLVLVAPRCIQGIQKPKFDKTRPLKLTETTAAMIVSALALISRL